MRGVECLPYRRDVVSVFAGIGTGVGRCVAVDANTGDVFGMCAVVENLLYGAGVACIVGGGAFGTAVFRFANAATDRGGRGTAVYRDRGTSVFGVGHGFVCTAAFVRRSNALYHTRIKRLAFLCERGYNKRVEFQM